jgi:hypothetical protein
VTYREKGKARSPALEKLAAGAQKTEAPSQTAMLLPAELARRLELAADVSHDRSGCMPLITIFVCLGAFVGLILAGKAELHFRTGDKVLVGLLVIAAIAFVVGSLHLSKAAAARRVKGVATLLAWEQAQPFPVTGFRDWLVNDRSVLVVHLRDALEKATFVDAVRAVDPAIEVEALGDKAFQLVLPSRVTTGENPSRFGDVGLLKTVFEKLVLPLHADVGIERVAMGGTIQDRV